MKKILSCILAVFMVFAAVFCLSSCDKKSYGNVFTSQEEMKTALEQAGVNLKYPQYTGEKSEKSDMQFVSVKDDKTGKLIGYKIYNFGSPFYVSVTAYNSESDKLMSDEESRMTFVSKLNCEKGEINVYSGKGHEDALYFIGCINIDGAHYEIRITNDETMQDNKYVHAIYDANEYYSSSLDTLVKVAESIK